MERAMGVQLALLDQEPQVRVQMEVPGQSLVQTTPQEQVAAQVQLAGQSLLPLTQAGLVVQDNSQTLLERLFNEAVVVVALGHPLVVQEAQAAVAQEDSKRLGCLHWERL